MRCLRPSWTQDGEPADPQGVVARPAADQLRGAVGIRVVQLAHPVRQLVDVVPPRAGARHVLDQRDERRIAPQRAERQQRGRGVPLLAVRRLVPQRGGGRSELRPRPGRRAPARPAA